MTRPTSTILVRVYQKLYDAFGPQQWWPAQTKFEMMVGAVLTQNTNWGNVEKALANLKQHAMLSPQALHKLPVSKLSQLIRPAGYFNVKAKRLKNFVAFFMMEYKGKLKNMVQEDFLVLRKKLLSVNGIGPETADSILLYACDKPVFVIDAYTKRFLYRHNLIERDEDYHVVQDLFMKALPHDFSMFNEYHALIVRLGKDYCRPKPACEECPLNNVRYSLTHRCRWCFRVLLKPERRIRRSGMSGCSKCVENE